jgi:dihydrofolate reductase
MKAIAAMALNRIIGANGVIPWHLPEDLRFFKETTVGQIVVMGRKTWDSLGRPLPGRENWVISRGSTIPGVRTFSDPAKVPQSPDGREIFVIGGAQIYAALLPRCDEFYLTLVKRDVEGDALLPVFENEFEMRELLKRAPDFEVRHYVRIKAAQP